MKKMYENRLGGGALEPKTVVGQGIEANCKSKQKAFTLAEVLITLAIIGVVAALTIPTVVAKYQKKALYTQFMKVYNTLSTVSDLSQEENGGVNSWMVNNCSHGDCSEYGDKYFAPFLKVAKVCDGSNATECIGDNVLELGGSDGSSESYPDQKANDEWAENISRAYLLQDGSAVVISEVYVEGNRSDYILIYTDTNGTKGPNIVGRDIFVFEIRDNKFGPAMDYELKETHIGPYGDEESKPGSCDPEDSESDGYGCADRLLREGAMNY